MKSRILFILKRRLDFDSTKHGHHNTLSTGLYNSVSFVNQMMQDAGFESHLVVAVDNNQIDREVKQFKPTHVVIEALWVVPEKFDILCRLHPSVKWIVRLHSELPFIASEGIAMDWIAEYARFPNVAVAINAPRALEELRSYVQIAQSLNQQQAIEKIPYLPNFYPQEYQLKPFRPKDGVINIGCFGAVRPLKNHLVQAVAAVRFAQSQGFKCRFHINDSRLEMKGEPVLNNLKGMFQQLVDSGHEMIGHEWRTRENFLELCAEMDMGLQVSFSETFNIVTADLISQGVPVVGSREIPWTSKWFAAEPTSSDDIVAKMKRTMRFPQANVWHNQQRLRKYTDSTISIWSAYFS